MQQLILWFNILGFTFLFASLGATYVVYSRFKPGWLSSYLLYIAFYAFFTIFNTYDFFSQVYLPPMSASFDTAAIFVTYITAVILLIIVPVFIFSLFDTPRTLRNNIFIISMVGLTIAIMIIALIHPDLGINRMGSIFMNGYLGLISLYGLIRLQKSNDTKRYGVVIPFLYISVIFYFIVVLQSIILPLLTDSLQEFHISLFTAGLICFLWGTITLAYLIIKNYSQEQLGPATLTEEIAARLGLTPREKEIINLLLLGKSNKEIGEKLFVSIRTVEAHIYNIYRKCSVKNKLELARKISGIF